MDSAKPARHRILIADDSEVCCVLLAMILKKTDHEVRCVFDGAQAVAAVREEPFDLVLLDHDMPKLDGLGALAMIRVLKPGLPVVICSGTITPEQTARFERLGAAQVVKKPVDPLRLRKIVDETVEWHRRQHAAAARETEERTTDAGARGREGATEQRALETPLLTGSSKAARRLTQEFARIRNFKTAAVVEGPVGSGALDIAVALADSQDGVVGLCAAEEVTEDLLANVLAPKRSDLGATKLIVTGSQRLTLDQQAMLDHLLGAHGGGGARSPFRNWRLILCVQGLLGEQAEAGKFDEHLLLRIGAMTVRMPSMEDRRGDLALMGQAILRRIGLGRTELTRGAQDWLEAQTWPRGYREFHRTIEMACPLVGPEKRINEEHLKRARESEPTERGPLFHDLVVESLRETAPIDNTQGVRAS